MHFSTQLLRLIIAITLIVTSLPALAQEFYPYDKKIKNPGKSVDKRCKKPLIYLRKLPAEARYSTYIEDGSIYIYFANAAVFYKLIKNKDDGFAIDLIFRSQYNCDSSPKPREGTVRGKLQKPLFKKDLKQRLQPQPAGGLVVHMGSLPDSIAPEDVEANLIYIYNGFACHYLSIYDIDLRDWELLETSLFQDTLSAKHISTSDSAALAKIMRFTIPFEKNRFDYKQQDIHALYDSLRLTDYTIKKIRIMALTSVEGSEEHNLKLQQQRAHSLVKAIEAYQGNTLEAQINSSENWKEFLQDVANTPYNKLNTYTKSAIKEQLANPKIAADLEPILKHHRKGLIELQLRKTVGFLDESEEKISSYFQQFLREEDIPKALQLQEVIFERIKNKSLTAAFLNHLEIPQLSVYGPLLLRRISFQYAELDKSEEETLEAFVQLQQILPDSPQLAYNIAALQLKKWTSTRDATEEKNIYNYINALRRKGIEQGLINRLLLNYYIVQAQRQLFAHNYQEKDRYLKLIHNTYSSANLTHEDALRLATYFAYYSRFDWAQRLLEPRVKQADASEDILFYYLSLTLKDKRNTQSKEWRQIQQRAYALNQERYCQIFSTRGSGGASFQLLDDAYLLETYCQQCVN